MKPAGWNHKGQFLERTIGRIFERAGFRVSLNTIQHNFEVDVIAEKGGLKVVAECKLYETSSINLTALIHEWKSKGTKLGADKILIVIGGQSVPSKFDQIAKEEGVYLWDEDYIHFTVSENLVNNVIFNAIEAFIKGFEEADDIVYEKIKHYKRKLIPGTEEYDLIYQRLYEEELVRKGLI